MSESTSIRHCARCQGALPPVWVFGGDEYLCQACYTKYGPSALEPSLLAAQQRVNDVRAQALDVTLWVPRQIDRCCPKCGQEANVSYNPGANGDIQMPTVEAAHYPRWNLRCPCGFEWEEAKP